MRLSLSLLLLVIAHAALNGQTQVRRRPVTFNSQNPGEEFLNKQWWLGFRAGINLSKATPEKSYSVLSPVNYTLGEKDYKNFADPGITASVEVTFYFKRISFSFIPTYRNSRFSYTYQFQWDDPSNANNLLELRYRADQSIDCAEFPLLVRYDLAHSRLRPYVQGGGYYTLVVNATKTVAVSGTDFASGGSGNFENPPVTVGAKELFAEAYAGIAFGGGVNYHLGNVRINFDVLYRKGLTLANSTEHRFDSEQIAGIADALDDITIDDLSITLGSMFPLRFLSSGFKSLDR